MYFNNLDKVLEETETATKKSPEETQQMVFKDIKSKVENDIGSRLKVARERLGLTQQALVHSCPLFTMETSSYSKWENGVNMPPYVFLAYLQEVHKVDLNELIAGTKVPVPALPQDVVNAIITLTNFNRQCQFGH